MTNTIPRLVSGSLLFFIVLPSLFLLFFCHVQFSDDVHPHSNHAKAPKSALGYHIFANKTPRAFAHRGSTRLFPQNTMFAFENSLALGADVLDMDARLTKDGEIVLVHDESILKVAGQDLLVQDLTLQELEQHDFGYMFSPATTAGSHSVVDESKKKFPYRGLGIKVATLRHVLTHTAAANTLLNIEMKIPGPGFIGTGQQQGGDIAKKLCALLGEFNAAHRVIVMSFSDAAWYHFRRVCPEVPTAPGPLTMLPFLLFSTLTMGEIKPPAFLVPFSALQPPAIVTTASVVQTARRAGVPVHVWTVDAPGDIDDLIEMQVDGIMSDRLDVLLESIGGGRGRGIVSETVLSKIPTGMACQEQDPLFAGMVQAGCATLRHRK